MSKIDMEVVLAQPGPFVPGDVIEGFVGITVNTSCTCRALKVALEWHTHGRVNKRHKAADQAVVFQGEVEGGQKGLHPFTLTVPPGPFPYQGENLTLEWRVRATADLPWAWDPETEVPVVLVPGEAKLDRVDSGPAGQGNLATQNQVADGIQGIVGVMLLFVGLMTFSCMSVGSCGSFLSGPSVSGLFGLVIASVVPVAFMLFGGRMVWRLVRQVVASQKLRSLAIEVPDGVYPGETVPISVVVHPQRELPVTEVRVRITCEERATRGSGTNRRTSVRSVFDHTVSLAKPGVIPATGPSTYTGEVTLAEGAPYTLAVPDGMVVWIVEAIVDCPGPLDPSVRKVLRVVPRVAVDR